MKKLLLLLSLIFLTSFSNAQEFIKFRQAWKLYALTSSNGKLSKDGKSFVFSNDDLSLSATPNKGMSVGFDHFDINISNNSDKKIIIELSKSNYIEDGKAVQIIDGETLVINKDNSNMEWIIPPHANSSKTIMELNNQDKFSQISYHEKISIYISYKIGDAEKDFSCDMSISKFKK